MFLVQGLVLRNQARTRGIIGKYKEGVMSQGCPWHWTLHPCIAWEGLPPRELTGQWVDALGEPVHLPGPALELAAEHVTVVFLLCRFCLRRLLGWG